MAALNFSIRLGAATPNLPVGHAEILQVPGEVGPKLRAMVRLDALDSHGKSAPHLVDEIGGGLDGVVGIDPEHAIPGGFVDGRELVEAAATEFEVLDIDLDRLPELPARNGGSRATARAFRSCSRALAAWPIPDLLSQEPLKAP